MATLRDYFESDCAQRDVVICFSEMAASNHQGNQMGSKMLIWHYIIHQTGTKFWSIFVPADVPFEAVIKCLSMKEILNCELIGQAPNASIDMGSAPGLRAEDYPEKISFHDLTFTKRVFLFIDRDLSSEQRSSIEKESEARGLKVIIRDAIYARKRSKAEKPLAFISHDSRDKEEVVRELVRELSIRGVPVWYDEYSLKIGNSLRESIERGLKEAQFCVLVLSPNFLTNNGWGKVEFNSVFTRELLEERNIVLPIWHNVSKQEVYEYSPSLANKYALSSTIGSRSLASRLAGRMLDDET